MAISLPTTWLPPRARRALSAQLRRRRELDVALATAKGLAPDDPRCARFQGPGACAALDRIARNMTCSGFRSDAAFTPAMASATYEGLVGHVSAP